MLSPKTHFEQVLIETAMSLATVEIPKATEIVKSPKKRKVKKTISGEQAQSQGPDYDES